MPPLISSVVAPSSDQQAARGLSEVDPAAFRHVVGRFATGVTVVSTTLQGVRYGMTVNSFTSVSIDPLLVLFCCQHKASIHAPLLASGHWAVSVLDARQIEVSRHFARSSPAGTDAWGEIPSIVGTADGDPLAPGSSATLECRTLATHPGGDHTVVIGTPVAITVADEAELSEPLLYFDSAYRTTSPEHLR